MDFRSVKGKFLKFGQTIVVDSSTFEMDPKEANSQQEEIPLEDGQDIEVGSHEGIFEDSDEPEIDTLLSDGPDDEDSDGEMSEETYEQLRYKGQKQFGIA